MPTPSNLYQLVYTSRSVNLFSEDQLRVLLEQARARNQSISITGLLLYKDLSFIQVLEGAKSSIEDVFLSINNDSRHFRIKVLVDMKPIGERFFPEWSMGFQRLDRHDAKQPPGFSDFLETELPSILEMENRDKRALNQLLSYFRSHS